MTGRILTGRPVAEAAVEIAAQGLGTHLSEEAYRTVVDLAEDRLVNYEGAYRVDLGGHLVKLTDIVATESARSAVVKPAQTPTGHDGPNPFAKDTWNFSQQMLLENTKPELARKLAAAAGN
jgi:hypothetical protein